MPHGLDTENEVFFYEQEFYVLSNFSSFQVDFQGHTFQTSEHAYHWAKFPDSLVCSSLVMAAKSAHDALKLAHEYEEFVRKDWKDVRVDIMRQILRAKVSQHPYVRKKLLETGDRTIIENSWRDDFWGWGPNKRGKNMLGKIWMEVRSEIRQSEGQ